MDKKKIIAIISMIILAVPVISQQMQDRPTFEQIEAEKIAFFTRYMDLNSQEARVFWPLYEEMQKQRNNLLHERHTLGRYFDRNCENLSPGELRELGDKWVELQGREAELARTYHEKFNEVLPPLKVMKFYQAENEFRMQLLRRVRGAGGGRGWGRQGRD